MIGVGIIKAYEKLINGRGWNYKKLRENHRWKGLKLRKYVII